MAAVGDRVVGAGNSNSVRNGKDFADTRGKIAVKVGEVTLSSSFDSGNLDCVKEQKCDSPDTYEYNLWTAPDCAGTEYQSGNRTWFYFSVITPTNFAGKTLRFNLMNLNKQSRLYQQGLTPMVRIVPGRGSWERLRDRVEYESVDGGLKLSFQYTVSENRRLTTYFAFCYPYSYSDCLKKLAKLDERFAATAENDKLREGDTHIYYHRELVCYSLEGRRIDLLTVSSYVGITEEREPRFTGLFPDLSCERARAFRGKKVFFLTSRVHPGETPSSHVFSGFLDFILRPDDPRAQTLRHHFVFKLIPMLNPDGVYHGYYRTDTRGVNLNRMYLSPNVELHPSIYATRILVLYHNSKGMDRCSPNDVHSSSQDHCLGRSASTGPGAVLEAGVKKCNSLESHDPGFDSNATTDCCKKETISFASDSLSCGGNAVRSSCHEVSLKSCYEEISDSLFHSFMSNTGTQAGGVNSNLASPSKSMDGGGEVTSGVNSCSDSCSNDNPNQKPDVSLNITETAESSEPDAISITKQSGIAFYVDLHAHASKRGCFLYGNYFKKELEQAENMLFPKVVSLNSPHLDFDHCVFSEKNMYTTDRRDGLSKEGSGRVALFKATGIIHSYTLECNYNSGRHSNVVTPATMDGGRASPPHLISPMAHRFSIADYEQVGQSLAVAALDMYQLNPWSRLPTSEYGSLAAVRQSLLLRIRNSRAKMAKSIPPPISHLLPPSVEDNPECPVPIGRGKLTSSGHPRSARALLFKRQRRQPAPRTLLIEQIAADIAQLTETERVKQKATFQGAKARDQRRQLGVRGCSALANLRKSGEEDNRPAQSIKPSLQCVVLPCGSLRVAGGIEEGNKGHNTRSSSTPSKCEAFWISLNTKKEKLGQRDVSKATGVSSQLKASTVDPMGTTQLHMLPLVQQRKKLMTHRPRRLLRRRARKETLTPENLGLTSAPYPAATKAASDSELILTLFGQMFFRKEIKISNAYKCCQSAETIPFTVIAWLP